MMKTLITLAISISIVACGGGASDGGNEPVDTSTPTQPSPTTSPTQPPTPTPLQLSNISLQAEKLFIVNDEEAIDIRVIAHYSNGVQEDVTEHATVSMANEGLGELWLYEDIWRYLPKYPGVEILQAEYKGLQDSENIEISYYVQSIEYKVNANVLPLGASIPLLDWGWVYLSNGVGVYPLHPYADYVSANSSIVDFEPIVPVEIVIDEYKTPEVGFIRTKSIGATTVHIDYEGRRFTESIEVLPYKLLTSRISAGHIGNRLFDVAIDEYGDTFILQGTAQTRQKFVISHFSEESNTWLENIIIDPEDFGTRNSFVDLYVNRYMIIVTWAASEGPTYAIYNRSTGEVEVFENSEYPDKPHTVDFDSQGRMIMCWNSSYLSESSPAASCIVRDNQSGLEFSKTFDFRISSVELTTDNKFFVISNEIKELTPKFIKAFIFQVGDSEITLLSESDVAAPDDFPGTSAFCTQMAISETGHMACGIVATQPEDVFDSSFYIITYHPESDWQMSHLFSGDEANLETFNAKLDIAPNGEISVLIPIERTGEVGEIRYEPGEGWQPLKTAIDLSPGTSVLDYPPVYTEQGWKVFVPQLRGYFTRTAETWEGPTKFKGVGQFAGMLGTVSFEVEFASNGDYAMGWIEPATFGHPDGGYVNNSLFFALPAGKH